MQTSNKIGTDPIYDARTPVSYTHLHIGDVILGGLGQVLPIAHPADIAAPARQGLHYRLGLG